jgi:fumarate reductase flavoprotein subunit
MIKKSALGLLIAAAALSVTLAGCPPGVSGDSGETGDPYSASGTRSGFGGNVRVVVTMDSAYTVITNVTAEGPGETTGIGSRALSELPPKMVEQNRVDIADTVTGATSTSNAVKGAAQDAYAILMGRKGQL